MPLSEDLFGTDTEGSAVKDYCKFCFQNGAFTEPELTLKAMIEKSVKHMTRKLNMSEEKAEVMANAVIPTLKRWQR